MFSVFMFVFANLSIVVNADNYLDNYNTVELSVAQKEYYLGEENVEFLKNNEIGIESISLDVSVQTMYAENGFSVSGAYKDIISSIKRDAETYNLSKEQIKNYIEASMATTPIIGNNKESVNSLSKNTRTVKAVNRPGDNGIGWEVMSLSEYSGATTFLTLPTIKNITSNTAAYMFYTVDTTDTILGVADFCMDFGVGYDYGDGGYKWRVFQVRNDEDFVSSEHMYKPFKDVNIDSNTLYFKVEHLKENPGYMKFEIVEGTSFSKVYVSYHFYVGSFGIYDTNTSFNKQITLCNSNHNYLTGTELLGAAYYNSYIYSTPNNISSKMYPEHCEDGELISGNLYELDRCGAFGTNETNVKQVVKNSGNNWYEENISIYFKQMP